MATVTQAALLTMKDVQGQLGISRSTVHRLMQSRDIEYLRVGAGLRFRPEAIQDYIQREIENAKAETDDSE